MFANNLGDHFSHTQTYFFFLIMLANNIGNQFSKVLYIVALNDKYTDLIFFFRVE